MRLFLVHLRFAERGVSNAFVGASDVLKMYRLATLVGRDNIDFYFWNGHRGDREMIFLYNKIRFVFLLKCLFLFELVEDHFFQNIFQKGLGY